MYLLRILLSTFFSTFLFASSLKPKEPKLCVNCRYFVPLSDGSKLEYGRCSLFPYISGKFFVDGITRSTDFYSCSTARSLSSMCGNDASKYKKKYTRKIHKKNEESEDK
jgi:hypothetical protein